MKMEWKRLGYNILALSLDITHAGVIAFLFWSVFYLSPSGWYTHHPFLHVVMLVVFTGTFLFHLIFHTCPLTWASQKLRSIYNHRFSFQWSYVVYYIKKYTGKKIPRWSITLTLIAFAVIIYVGYIHATGSFW